MRNFTKDKDYLRDFFEHAPIGFHSFGPDRSIIDMNQAELNMLGYKREEIVGKKSWADLIIPAQIPLFEQHWQDINIHGEVKNFHYTVLRKDGQPLNVLLNASARFNESGKLLNTRGSIVNVTERRRREEKYRLQGNIHKNIEETIFPLIEKLKRRGSSLDQRHLVLLEKSLMDLTSGFPFRLMDKKWRLSQREIEICKMLKNGLKTKNMADLLSTSLRTIEHHRAHIRKKLGIGESSMDLAVYLKAFMM